VLIFVLMRSLYIAALGILLFRPLPVFACSCGPAAPACAYVNLASAVFVGKVIFTNDDGSGTFLQKTLVHFEVEESFKGLSPVTHEVWIDPGSFSSCYAEYHVGERLLVFAYGGAVMPPDTPAVTLGTGKSVKSKPLPPGIDPSKLLTVYSSSECSGTRLLSPETENLIRPEIDYLRRFKAGSAAPLVTGQVTRDRYFGFLNAAGIAGAKVNLTGRDFQRSARTDPEGRYRIEAVPPGRYTVSCSLAAYTSSQKAIKVEVPSSGCAYADFDLIGTGMIRGQIVDHNGHPARKIKVTILRLGQDLKPIYEASKIIESDSHGKFRFEKLADGEFWIGANLSSVPNEETPFPATTWSENGSYEIHLDPGEHKQLLSFKLPPPYVVRVFPVQVRWPDGRPAEHVSVWAEVGNEAATFADTDSKGLAHLDLLEGITYAIEAKIWVNTGNRKEVARSGALQVLLGSEPGQLSLVLDRRTSRYR
jgi:hypothetical protein